MDSGIQTNTKNPKGNKCTGRTADTAPGSSRPGRKPKEEEPGINDANLLRIIEVVFPKTTDKLAGLVDFRVQGRITYSVKELLFPAVIARVIGNTSSREHDFEKRNVCYVNNLLHICGSPLDHLAHSDTIKHFLEGEPSCFLGNLLPAFFQELVRKKRAYGMCCPPELNRGKAAFIIAIDGVHFHTSHAAIKHSTHRTHSDGTAEYMLIALQATVVSAGGARIPLMVEFIENPDGEFNKQDCELNACKRLLERLRNHFPHMKAILLMDGLYLCEDILKQCRRNGWDYSITVTDHASVFQEKALNAIEERRECRIIDRERSSGCARIVSWRNNVRHCFGGTEFCLNVVRMETINSRGDKETMFYATSLFLHRAKSLAARTLDEVCRLRWQIEESFNEQKHHGFELGTAFGTRGYAGQNYYLVVQFAYIILTVMRHSSLFRRLQQHENPGWIAAPIQRPMMEWYRGLGNLMLRLKTALTCRLIDNIDMSGWRLSFDTA